MTQSEGSIKEEVKKRVEEEKDIQFVVVDSRDIESGPGEKGREMDGWKMKCPVVLVSETAKA